MLTRCFSRIRTSCVLTPHEGEFSQIFYLEKPRGTAVRISLQSALKELEKTECFE